MDTFVQLVDAARTLVASPQGLAAALVIMIVGLGLLLSKAIDNGFTLKVNGKR
jgi:hypothetical protein